MNLLWIAPDKLSDPRQSSRDRSGHGPLLFRSTFFFRAPSCPFLHFSYLMAFPSNVVSMIKVRDVVKERVFSLLVDAE